MRLGQSVVRRRATFNALIGATVEHGREKTPALFNFRDLRRKRLVFSLGLLENSAFINVWEKRRFGKATGTSTVKNSALISF
jgi:hypothetical protein